MNPLMGGLIGVVLGVAVFLFASYNSGMYSNSHEEYRAGNDGQGFFDESPMCSICLDCLNKKRIRTLRCGHRFHDECIELDIRSYRATPPNCPNCRARI